MSDGKGGLGRGLAALLPSDAQGGAGLREIALEQIRPNPRQPRTDFDQAGLDELAASIRAVGVLQPILVRRAGDAFELVAGERRLRACRIAGLSTVPAVVRDVADDVMLRDALIENIQRVDLNPLEEAAAYRQLVDELSVTHEELAQRVGKSRSAITNSLRLLQLAPEAQERVASGALSAAHGRAIAALQAPAAQARAAARAVAEGLSVRETEELVRRLGAHDGALTSRAHASRAERPAAILEAEAALSDMLETRVKIDAGRKRGTIVIEYAGLEDLDRIVRAIAVSAP